MPVEDFDLTRIQLDAQSGALTTRGPQVLLCTEGGAELTSPERTLTLGKGAAAFVPAGTEVTASGPAVLYRATTNLALFAPGG